MKEFKTAHSRMFNKRRLNPESSLDYNNNTGEERDKKEQLESQAVQDEKAAELSGSLANWKHHQHQDESNNLRPTERDPLSPRITKTDINSNRMPHSAAHATQLHLAPAN